jgi:hypothetical protein
VLELFIYKIEIKNVLRGGCSCQRLAMGFLLSSILNKLREVPSSLKNGTYMLFYKIWHSSPIFLSQTMANRILRVPTNFHIPWRSAFFFFKRLQWSDQLSCKINDEQMKHASQGVLNSIWKIVNLTTMSS